jgi:hypothetical protein
MSGLTLIAVIAFVAIGLVVWIVDAANAGAERAKQERLEAKQQREQKKLEDKVRTEVAIGFVRDTAPELAALRKAVTVLRDFVADANAYRPKFTGPSDMSFRQVRFSFPFDVFFPRDCEGSGDGPDPEPWATTIGNLLVPKAHELPSIYMKYIEPSSFKYINTFPRSSPILSFDPPPPPKYPQVELPDIKTVADRKFLTRLRKLFTFELSQNWKLQEATNQLQNEFAEQKGKAEEARVSMDNHIACRIGISGSAEFPDERI